MKTQLMTAALSLFLVSPVWAQSGTSTMDRSGQTGTSEDTRTSPGYSDRSGDRTKKGTTQESERRASKKGTKSTHEMDEGRDSQKPAEQNQQRSQ